MLKKFLANILCRRIREAFPDMRRNITTLLTAEKHKLAQLGDPRPGAHQRRQYLNKVVRNYHELAQQALKSPEELPSSAMKLRGMVYHAAEAFAAEMRTSGNLYEFVDIEETEKNPRQLLRPLEYHHVCYLSTSAPHCT